MPAFCVISKVRVAVANIYIVGISMSNKLNRVAVFTSETGLACPISKETFTAAISEFNC